MQWVDGRLRGRWFHWRLPFLLLLVAVLAGCGGGNATSLPPLASSAPASAPGTSASSTAIATIAAGPSERPISSIPTTPRPQASTRPTASATPAGTPRPVTLRVPRGANMTALSEQQQLTLPEGFQIAVFAAGLGAPRLLAWSPEGDLVVSQTVASNGKVFILPDRDRNGQSDKTIVFAQGLHNPHGLAFHDGFLYVAEENEVVRFRWQGGGPATGKPEVIVPDLPAGKGHRTRTIGFGPDGKLYVAVGSSCNVCKEEDQRRAAIMQYNADGSAGRLYARGLRNAVGFTWRPGAGELWATNNGRDNLGDDLPPETINLVHDGNDFGWPYCHNGTIVDKEFGDLGSCATVTRPAVEMQAHSAPLGLTFNTSATFPADYAGDLFVAFHGSWNRTQPTGYKIVRVRFRDGKPTGQVEDFISGWLQPDGNEWGRPVDVSVGADGNLYITDDSLGVVYRVSYGR